MMRDAKLNRYCELKTRIKQMEEELDSLREEIVTAYPADVEFQLQDYTLKLIYQDKKQYDDQLLFAALPDPELWKAVFKADPAKISALVKTNIIPEKCLEGTYKVSRSPYLYVKPH